MASVDAELGRASRGAVRRPRPVAAGAVASHDRRELWPGTLRRAWAAVSQPPMRAPERWPAHRRTGRRTRHHPDSASVMIGPMSVRTRSGHRTAQGREGRRDRRDRAGAARVHDPGRPRGRRDPGRAAGRAGAGRRAAQSAQPRPAERRARPQEARGGRDRARAGRGTPTSSSRGCAPASPSGSASGPSDCHAVNPRLVYGRMTGWGQDGPLAQAAGHDMNYIAITGALHGLGQDKSRPHFPTNLVGDFGGGSTYLVIGILAALLEARVSGQGQVVDAAIVDGTAHLNAMTAAFLAAGGYTEERARQPARRRRAVLRHLRDLRRQAHVGRRAGAAVLRPVRRRCSASRTTAPGPLRPRPGRRAARRSSPTPSRSGPRPSGSRSSRAPTPASPASSRSARPSSTRT